MDNNRGLLFFMTGCAAGLAAGMMLNSKPGRATIDTLRQKADEGTKTVKESVDKLSEAVTSAASRGVRTVRHEAENLVAAVDAGKNAYRSAKE